jgi:hypothetical protein
MKERRGFGGETIMMQMVNLSALMMCKPAQASAFDVPATGFLNQSISMTSRYIIYCAKHWPSCVGSVMPGVRTLKRKPEGLWQHVGVGCVAVATWV